MSETRVVFTTRDNGPECLACEAEIHFGDGFGPLAGMKLVGFSLWFSPEGEVYVTFPSRAFGAGQERRFFDFVRPVEGQACDAKRLKAWILSSYYAEAIERGDVETMPAYLSGPGSVGGDPGCVCDPTRGDDEEA